MLRVALVGVGERAELVKLLPTMPGHPVAVAAIDPLESRRRRAQQEFGIPLVGVSVDELDDLNIDAALVTTPDHTHAEVACALLRMGIPVFLEKPIAISLDDADLILKTSLDTGTKLYVGHNMRHMQVIRLLKQLIDSGEIGEVKAIWCRHFVGNGGDYYFRDWHAERRYTASLLLQKGVHDIDVIHWLAGGVAQLVVGIGDRQVYGRMESHSKPGDDRPGGLMSTWHSHDKWPPEVLTGLNPNSDVEDISMVLMRLDNGVLASYEQCHFTPDYWRNYTVIGTRGRIENFGDGEGSIVRLWNQRGEYRPEADAEYLVSQDGEGHEDADEKTLSEFFTFVLTGDDTETSPVAAREAVATGLAATESLRRGSIPVAVPPWNPR